MRYKTKAFNQRISSFVCRTNRFCTILIPHRENSKDRLGLGLQRWRYANLPNLMMMISSLWGLYLLDVRLLMTGHDDTMP